VDDYLTVHIHRNSGKKEKTWYSGRSGECILNGAYTNNPQVLVRYDVSGPDDEHLSLVLSQYKKSNALAYTLACFSTESFTLDRPQKDLLHSCDFSTLLTQTGGPVGTREYALNPMFAIGVPEGGAIVQLKISTAKTVAVNAMLVPVSSYGDRVERAKGEPVLDSGKYRHGFVVTKRRTVNAGSYVLIVSRFTRNDPATVFNLQVSSSIRLKVEQIQ
jgi:hypothetical protein